MSKREVIAYAISHAPKGVKGGPYEAPYPRTWGAATPDLRGAYREERLRAARVAAQFVRNNGIPTARVIRIVRARPSEASAVEASGPDPMPVARAALRFADHCTPALEGSAWFEATREFIDAVETYRKGGGR